MSTKDKIIDKHKKIIDELKEHNKYYFVNDKPKITDSEYDKIKKKATDLERKYPYLKKNLSVKNLIGGLIGLFVATIGVHLTTGI